MPGRFRVPVVGGVLALCAGVAVALLGSALTASRMDLLSTTSTLSALYFLAAFIFGAVSPRHSWVWGLWLVLPLGFLFLLSLVFSGSVLAFVQYDAVPLLGAVVGAALGGVAGALVGTKLLRTGRATP
jgi:hypothetical protein